MWELFWVRNISYVIEVFVAFLMITAAWIYLDGWAVEKRARTLVRAIGFLVLGLWCFLNGAPPDMTFIKSITDSVGVIGFGLVLASLLLDPIPIKPGEKPLKILSKLWPREIPAVVPVAPFFLASIQSFLYKFLALPILYALVFLSEGKLWIFTFSVCITALLYFHYKQGVQIEWKYFYLSFLVLSVSLFLGLIAEFLQNSPNILVSTIFAEYKVEWVIENAIKLSGVVFLGAWAWGFIRFRIFPQIFSSFIALTFLSFVTMTIIYTGFLVNRAQESAVKDLEINVKTFNFALEKIKTSAILAARLVAENVQVREAVERDNKSSLYSNLNKLMFENETDFMVAVNTGGEVLMHGEDRSRFGESIADDPVVWRALDGKIVVNTAVEKSVTVPRVSIRAASPIVDTEGGEPKIVGAIITGFLLDTAFVDGIKKITGLDVTVFANDTRSANTITVPGSQSRLIGTRESDRKILETVLQNRDTYIGTAMILSQSYLASYIPINDVEDTTVGMFFTGRSQASILDLTSRTIQLTFLISTLLMLISLIPLRALASFITKHQEI